MIELPIWFGSLILLLVGVFFVKIGSYDSTGDLSFISQLGGALMVVIGGLLFVMSLGIMVTWV